ncbi:MAG: phosphopantetheine-binding protein [Eubacteriales bacterium]
MTRDDVIQRTKEIIRDNVPDMVEGELTEDTHINTETHIDSMGFILVMSKLEGEFNAHVPDEEWMKIVTIGDVADAIMRHSEQVQ